MSCELNTFSLRFVACPTHRSRCAQRLFYSYVFVTFRVYGSHKLACARSFALVCCCLGDGDCVFYCHYYCRSCAFCAKGKTHAILFVFYSTCALRNALKCWTTQVETEIVELNSVSRWTNAHAQQNQWKMECIIFAVIIEWFLLFVRQQHRICKFGASAIGTKDEKKNGRTNKNRRNIENLAAIAFVCVEMWRIILFNIVNVLAVGMQCVRFHLKRN